MSRRFITAVVAYLVALRGSARRRRPPERAARLRTRSLPDWLPWWRRA